MIISNSVTRLEALHLSHCQEINNHPKIICCWLYYMPQSRFLLVLISQHVISKWFQLLLMPCTLLLMSQSYVSQYICIYIYTHIYTWLCIFILFYIHVYIYIVCYKYSMYEYIYIYINTVYSMSFCHGFNLGSFPQMIPGASGSHAAPA